MVEYKGLPFGYQWVLFLDQCLRKRMAKYIHKIVTFSDDDFIFGRPTIKISNGIDFNSIPLKQPQTVLNEELHLIAVATIHPWHGFDRAIKGLIEYYQMSQKRKVFLHIIGAGVPAVLDAYHELVANHETLKDYIHFYGPLFGKELDDLFNQCQMGIGSLARHRSGITNLRSLKNREYAARGIPFVYSENDYDFEERPYVLKVPADETNISIKDLIRFYDSVKLTPQEIRNSIDPELSWEKQMLKVIENL
ncbi:MAG: glycosyltransferase family 1 protein [Candidatus Moranbacteria bacterium]|nr:glycosyltransferase family 1 protein [Candidatus Moranbacteria bacterium]